MVTESRRAWVQPLVFTMLALLAIVCVTLISAALSELDSTCDLTFHPTDNVGTADNDGVAPPILSGSMGRVTGRETKIGWEYDRTKSLSDSKAFRFVHVSKCGGSSFIAWALDENNVRYPGGPPMLPNFEPKDTAGYETGNLYDKKRFPRATSLITLRSPRSHMLSMFKECRFNRWGRHTIKRRKQNNLPTVPHSGTHVEDFMQWIDYFLTSYDTYVPNTGAMLC